MKAATVEAMVLGVQKGMHPELRSASHQLTLGKLIHVPSLNILICEMGTAAFGVK